MEAQDKHRIRISLFSNSTKLKIEQFDPARIDYIYEWDLLLNVYSRLLSFNRESSLVSGFAKKFYWKGNEAHFEIRDDFKTVDGYVIKPEDIAFSLKRLIILSSNTHGKIENIVCDLKEIKNINQDCDGIKFNNKELIIKTKEKDLFLFKTLTAVDFSIIPKKSIDPKTLKIIDYRNTSGLYYFSGYVNDNIVLKINHNHWLYSSNIPQEIEIIPDFIGEKDNHKKVSYKIENNGLDVISKTSTLKVFEFEKLSKELKEKNIKYDIHVTEPIMLISLKMTSRGFALDKKMRFAILQDIQKCLRREKEYLNVISRQQTSYIFQPNTHGGLLEQQRTDYEEKLLSPIDKTISKTTIDVGVIEFLLPVYSKILSNSYFKYNLITYPTHNDYTDNKFADRRPHLLVTSQDIMFEEDINLLSFSFNSAGMFHLKGKEADKWISTFRHEENTKVRMEMIRKLHYDSLITNTSVIPLSTVSVGAIAINGWKLNFSTFTADTPFWLIERDN